MALELSSEDFTLLKRVLERYVSDLRMEIAGTENADWRKDMHADEDRAKALLERLSGPQLAAGNDAPASFGVADHPVAFMCVELDPTACHRHRLSLALEEQGLRGFDL